MSTPASSRKHGSYFQAIRVGRSQRISTSGTSAASSTLDGDTSLLELFPTQDCWIKLGESGATTAAVNDGTSMFLPGGIKGFVGVPENLANPVIAVIQDSTGGYLHLTEAADTGA